MNFHFHLPFLTADQLGAHAVGDYVLQSHWMATIKTKKGLAAFVHVATYVLPFLILTCDWRALAFIGITHFVIDRWRLARYVCWVKNHLGPWPVCPGCPDPVYLDEVSSHGTMARVHMPHRLPPIASWTECQATGYPPDVPAWLSVWLLIITDNILHIFLNALALQVWS